MELEQTLIDKIVEKVCKNYDKYEWFDHGDMRKLLYREYESISKLDDFKFTTEIGMQFNPNKWHILLVITKNNILLYSYNYDYHVKLQGCVPAEPNALLGAYANLTYSEIRDDTIQNVKKNIITELFNNIEKLLFQKELNKLREANYEQHKQRIDQITKVANDFLMEE